MKQFILIIPFLISCHTNKVDNQIASNPRIIDIDNAIYMGQSLNLSEIASSIKYIAFETSDESLITDGANFKVTDNYFLVSQKGQIMQFDESGEFIRNLVNVGRGPGEGFSRCFEIDDLGKNLYMYSNFAHKILQYNLSNGEFNNTLEDPETDFWTENFHYYKDCLLFVSNNSSEKFFFKVYNIETMLSVLEWPIRYQTTSRSYNSIAEYSSVYFQNLKDTLLFKEMFSDTLYQTTDLKDCKPRYIFKGGDKLTYELYQQFLANSSKIKIDDKLTIGRFFETSDFLFFYGYIKNGSHICVYDKIENNLKIYNSREIINDLDGGPNFKMTWNPHSTLFRDGNIFCILESFQTLKDIDISKVKSNEFKNIIESGNESSNPTLMVVKIME